MISIDVHIVEFIKEVKEQVKEVLEQASIDTVEWINNNSTSLFSNGGKKFVETLYNESQVNGNNIECVAGWTTSLGPILEYGPEKTSWDIEAKDGKNLKFPIGGKAIFVKKVHREWKEESKRPHFQPAIEAIEPILEERLNGIFNNK